jgi:hypothetical protein
MATELLLLRVKGTMMEKRRVLDERQFKVVDAGDVEMDWMR